MGLRAIREQGGVTLVQDPATAKFDGMPRSAVDAGLADIVASAEELPERIINCRKHTQMLSRKDSTPEDGMQGSLEKTMILLRAHTGHDFSLYKRNTLYRRIERRMGIHQIPKIATYVRYLQENSQELDLLFKELLIGVTSFFRDPRCGISCETRSFQRYSLVVAQGAPCEPGSPDVPPARSVFPGHRLQGGNGKGRCGELHPANIRHGSGWGRHRPGAPGSISCHH